MFPGSVFCFRSLPSLLALWATSIYRYVRYMTFFVLLLSQPTVCVGVLSLCLFSLVRVYSTGIFEKYLTWCALCCATLGT